MRQLYLVAGVTMAGVSAVFALFAELEKRYDLSTTSLGWIAGSAFIASLIAQLWLSRYADRGHAATLLRLGVLAAAVGLIWFAAATEVWQFVSARALLGAGVGMIVPPARRAIVISADGNSGERLGTFYASYLAGFVFGPPIAGVLTIVGDVRLPFAVFGVLTFLTLLSILRMELPEGRPVGGAEGASAEAAADKRVLRRLLVERRIVAALLVVVSFRYSIGVFEPLWATHLDDLGASTTTVTLSLTFFALPMLLVARPAGRLSDRVGPRWASLLAALATVPMMATYGYAGVVWIIFAVAIPHGSHGGDPVAWLPSLRSPKQRPRAMPPRLKGFAEASGSAAAAIGAFTAPALFDLLGAGPAWLVAAIVMGGLLATSWFLDPPRRPSTSAGETLTTVDRQGDAGDEASLVAVEEQRRVGDIPT